MNYDAAAEADFANQRLAEIFHRATSPSEAIQEIGQTTEHEMHHGGKPDNRGLFVYVHKET
jgi:hypothetical protein